ncbi:dethiobiotin synthase [Muriicola marianensis]|uniref:ATP-dependent dethiobiotin synthetase BioD n=1 Tax=Muriicola marianensis TaxID=1324801 RepID=A0ABQ1R1U9_9FLAO|nr:dethiobiotin synthase [Muriicola marianensis]GGD52019.1 ATP-dependent dethiobiotin synthetase BioD [Muriicola marianensis]
MKRIFVTGISTEVGKTIASAILVEALLADYWKPVQAGDLDHSDSHKVRNLISNPKTVIHQNSYALKTPMSPHAAAGIDGIRIDLDQITEPDTENHLVIEGAGGLLVPLNDNDTIADLIKPDYKVVVVSRHYLGSINHSLLTIEALRARGIEPVILFSGNEHPTTESIILSKTGVQCVGRISEEGNFDKETIRKYATMFREALMAL